MKKGYTHHMKPSPTPSVKTRFAPSPTGLMHLGGLRTALFAYLLAKVNKGEFYLRIEDTDQDRFYEGAVEDIKHSLKWAGISWQEPVLYQSQRLELYQKYASLLVDRGYAYRCFCSKQRLATLRQNNTHRGYDRKCRELSETAIKRHLDSQTPYVIRLKMPLSGVLTVTDEILGHIDYPAEQLDDAVILKSDGYPTYHLGHVVDDHLMDITHVLRGQEWISTYPLHQQLWDSLQWKRPMYMHLPLITGSDGGKLSKRNQSVSVTEYIKKGYLPEGMINFLALLGWSYDEFRTLFTLKDLEECFSTQGFSKSHAMFSPEKLNYLNNHYIQKLEPDEFIKHARSIGIHLYTKDFCHDNLDQIHLLYQSRLNHISELTEHTKFLHSHTLNYKDVLAASPFQPYELITRLKVLKNMCLNPLMLWDKPSIKTHLKTITKHHNIKMFDLMMPLRMAVTASTQSPSIVDLCALIHRDTVTNRITELIEQASA